MQPSFKLPLKEANALARYFGVTYNSKAQTLPDLRKLLHGRWMGAQPFKAAITLSVIAPSSRCMHPA